MSATAWVRRLVHTAFLVVALLVLTFALPRLLPGDPAERYYADPRVSPQDKEDILAAFGLDAPISVQFWRHVRNLARGDLGHSFVYRKPVHQVIAERAMWSLALAAPALVLGTILGLVVGTYAGWSPGTRLDRAVLGLSMVLSSVPSFWLGILLLYTFCYAWPILPAYGVDPNTWTLIAVPRRLFGVTRHGLLPVGTLTSEIAVMATLLTRSGLVSVVGSEYLSVARAKGLSEQQVIVRHALRNALLPLVTGLGTRAASLLGGVVIVESVFSWPGMGLLLLEATRARDYPLMQGCFLLLALLAVLANLMADLIGMIIDPRTRDRGQ